MPLTYQQLLKQISAKSKEDGESLQPPCSAKDLTDLQAQARKELGVELPSGYTEFLRQHDGLDWNGLVIFASKTVPIVGYKDRFIEGFIDWNLEFRDDDWKNQYVVFGDSGMDLYVFEPKRKKYSARDCVSLDQNESYKSFEEMITAALRQHL
jgi:hypothetical protein